MEWEDDCKKGHRFEWNDVKGNLEEKASGRGARTEISWLAQMN
jgi:hypothetical protein